MGLSKKKTKKKRIEIEFKWQAIGLEHLHLTSAYKREKIAQNRANWRKLIQEAGSINDVYFMQLQLCNLCNYGPLISHR